MNHVINVIVAGPEEAYNGNAELWSGADMVAVTTIHEGQLHLRIDPRRDGRPGSSTPQPRGRSRRGGASDRHVLTPCSEES